MSTNTRFLLLGGVGTVRGRIRNAGRALVAVCDDLDPILEQTGFRNAAPFKQIDGIIRFSRRSIEGAEILGVRNGILSFASEIDMTPLERADVSLVTLEFRQVILCALIEIGQTYNLPIAPLIEMRERGD